MVLLSPRAWAEKYGHHQILEAFARAHPRFGDKTVILVFKVYNQANYDPNGDGDYEAKIRARVDELNMANWVRWVSEVPMERLPELYVMSDVVVNFPAMDAFPVTFMEAAACKRLVISCKLPAYVGTFAERSFSLVPPGDIDLLAQAIANVSNSGLKVWENRLEEARKTVLSEYSEEVTTQHMLSSYHRLANGH